MRKNRKLLLKYLLLVSVLMLMMLLCACRVRLTNNTEVASTIEDEDGWLSEDYQMRRDLLGEPVAERPIFKGFESEDDTEDYSDMDYEPLDYDQGTIDEWDEPEDTSSSTNTNSNSGSNSGNRSNNGSSSGEEDEPEIETVTVSIDLNDGEGVVNTMEVEKGSLFGDINIDFATAPEGYSFDGWHTEKDKDSPVDPEAAITEDCTIYAHWKKVVPAEYSVEIDLAGGKLKNVTSIKIKDGKYPNKLPEPTKKDFHFAGWYTQDGIKAEPGQECTEKKKLTARWEDHPTYWKNRYDTASNKEDFKDTFYAKDSISDLVKGERKEKAEDKPKYIFIGIDDFNEENANSVITEQRKKYKDSTIVVIPNGGDALRQVYRLILLKYMYGDASTITDEDITNAAKDLKVTLPESGPPYYYENKAPEADAKDAEDPEIKG